MCARVRVCGCRARGVRAPVWSVCVWVSQSTWAASGRLAGMVGWGTNYTGNTEIETKQMCCKESTVSEVWYVLGFMYPYQIYRTKFS